MVKAKRSFYDRAWEALQERFPNEKPTQTRLAALAGVKQPTVNDWKTGYPKMETVVRLAGNLRVCVQWLFAEDGPKHPAEAPLATVWPELDDSQRAQIEQFAKFVKREKS